MNRLLRVSVYWCGLGLTVTGLLYAVPRYVERYFDLIWEPWGSPSLLMKAHGAFGFWSLLLLGVVWRAHVRTKLRRPDNRGSGLGVVTLVSLLVVSGYFLYYAGSLEFREATSLLHTAGGVVLVGLLAWHAAYRRRNALDRGQAAE